MVANISPASLSTRRHSQGNNPNNPIVVENEGVTLPRFGQSAVPTPAQLLTTLSAQKDLFPVLEQLLVILRRGTDPPDQPPPNLLQSPSKRRKLSRVPAGAADWDVPFPFPPGEGPPNYKEEWTNERCERLISDFIALLREGATKAAAKRATSQPAPQSPTQSHSTPSRWSLPPTNDNRRSPSSNYAPLPLDAYLRPTAPYSYPAFAPTPTPVQSLGAVADLLASMSGAVLPPQDDHLPDSDPFGLSMDPLPPGFDLDPLLLSLMGTGPPREGLSEAQSPAPSEETSTPSLSHSPCPSQSISSGTSPMTPNFDPSLAMSPLPSGSAVRQQDQAGIFGPALPLRAQDGMELGMDVDDDFSRIFGIEADASRGVNAADQPPHFYDPSSIELPTFPSLELLSQPTDQAILSVNTPALSTPLPSPMLSQEVFDIPSLTSQPNPLPSSSNAKLSAFSTSSLQRQRPVPKRPTPPTPPLKTKAAATSAVAKKRREDAIQQGKDLRRRLLADIGKSKVQLWELTMEQGVLTRMSKDERIKRS